MEFKDVLPYIVSALLAVSSAAVSIWIARMQCKNEINNYRKQNLYDLKREAILDALSLINDYYSWLTYEHMPIRKKEISPESLTFEARVCYERLCLSVENPSLLNSFLEVIFTKSDQPLALINGFRNEARKELGLNKIELDSDRIFISKLSTTDLNHKKSKEP